MMMSMTMTISARATLFHPPVHLLHSLSIAPHNISNMSDAIEIILQLFYLPHYIIETCYLEVRHLDRIAGTVILLLCRHLRLSGQVIYPLGDLTHQLVEVPR